MSTKITWVLVALCTAGSLFAGGALLSSAGGRISHANDFAMERLALSTHAHLLNTQLAALATSRLDAPDGLVRMQTANRAFLTSARALGAGLSRGEAAGYAPLVYGFKRCVLAYQADVGQAQARHSHISAQDATTASRCFLGLMPRSAELLRRDTDLNYEAAAVGQDNIQNLLPQVVIPTILLSVAGNVFIISLLAAAIISLAAAAWLRNREAGGRVKALRSQPTLNDVLAPRIAQAHVVERDVTLNVAKTDTAPDAPPDAGALRAALHRVLSDVTHFQAAGNDLRSLVDVTVPELARVLHAARHLRGHVENAHSVAVAASAAAGQSEESARREFDETAKSLAATISDIHENMQHVHVRTAEIAQVATLLHELASQINLLAIKTATKSANAGDSGKIVAIVANAVAKLTEQSLEQSENLATMTDALRKQAAAMVNATETSSVAVEATSKTAAYTVSTLGTIRRDMQTLADQLHEVTAASGGETDAATSLDAEFDKMRATLAAVCSTLEMADASAQAGRDVLQAPSAATT